MYHDLDARDSAIWHDRIAKREAIAGPRVGDFCIMPDGEERRFTHDWHDSIQTNMPDLGYGSFYLDRSGGMDYSGGLHPSIPKTRLVDTGETRDGTCWFFRHNEARAHNSVTVLVPCRVYRVTE